MKQKTELCHILDKLKKANINTVLLQTRVRATSIFQTSDLSGNEPWDGCLSGFPGRSPGYDALQYAIEECHKRGMECHAWIVTIPVGKWNGTGCVALRRKHPGWVLKIGDEGYMDPASTDVADYLADYCADVVRRYDVDGVHLDYIRYPEEMKRLPSPAEGRRNITRIVQRIHDSVKDIKPWVKMSCSPIGKHDDTRQYWSRGWNARSRVFQDAKEWMRLGLMDVEFPMMYFRGNNFYPFALDWKEGAYGKQVVPGLGIYFMHPREKNWPLEEITRQMSVLRLYNMGFCFFRSKFFTDDTKGLYEFVANHFCRYPAFVPKIQNDYISPAFVSSIALSVKSIKSGDHIESTLYWSDAIDNSDGDYLTYNVYSSDNYPVDITDPRNIVAIRVNSTSITVRDVRHRYYAVCAVDRYGNVSVPCQQAGALEEPRNIKPAWYYVTHPLGR